MRHIVVILIAIIFWLLMFFFKKQKEKLFICALVTMSIVSGVYCYTHADGILAKRHPFNQTFYDSKYVESGEFPDAFLRLFLKDKTVNVKSDRLTLEEAEGQGYEWQYSYYHVENMVNYLKSVEAIPVEDSSLDRCCVDGDSLSDFENLGYLNDLLRNTMMRSNYDEMSGSYLSYLWYYRDLAKTSYIYVNTESLNEEELVLLWQPQNDEEPYTEDMYLMGKTYFEDNIK